ncbi:growth hormone secretagogue receptor type 1-like [Lytechinus variegatus]|uniref:growth hormone secretagogue receptor type 1-like n=1 Tax=Lytechinus variegatus TaxID=7654 RepID=UPI001BB20485|nr:growth hormone secretagogue receptor type 1-like [Lytechinus variegatus]
MERYIAIGHPIYFNRILTRGRVAISIVIIWLFAIITSFPRVFTTSVHNMDTRSTSGICVYKYANQASQVTLSVFLFCLRLLVPTMVTFTTQILIARHLYRHARTFQRQNNASFHGVARRRVLKLMLIVIVTYIICWGPTQVATFLFFFGVLPPTFRKSRGWTLLFVLSLFNSCVNPIIYAIRFKEFREAVFSMFRKERRPLTGIFEQEKQKRSNDRDSPTGMQEGGSSSTK